MRAIIYARCSTDEKKQDVEVQLQQLRTYCETNGWNYDEVSEYSSGSKHIPPKLQQVLQLIGSRTYQVLIVYSMDRFSRLPPSKTERLLNHVIDSGCRFITIAERLDSENPLIWYSMKGMWIYFANLYSQNLSKKVKLGMERAREKGIHCGRPKGAKDKKKRAKKGYYLRKYKFKLK